MFRCIRRVTRRCMFMMTAMRPVLLIMVTVLFFIAYHLFNHLEYNRFLSTSQFESRFSGIDSKLDDGDDWLKGSGLNNPVVILENNKKHVVPGNARDSNVGNVRDNNGPPDHSEWILAIEPGNKNGIHDNSYRNEQHSRLPTERKNIRKNIFSSPNRTLVKDKVKVRVKEDSGSFPSPSVSAVNTETTQELPDSSSRSTKNESTYKKKLEAPGDQKGRSAAELQVFHNPSYNLPSLDKLARAPFQPKVVYSSGSFLDRLKAYNEAIAAVRADIFHVRGEFSEWKDVMDASRLAVIWGARDDFLIQLAARPEVQTVILPWTTPVDAGVVVSWSQWSSLRDTSNLLVQEYYDWSASEPLCMWIETRGLTKARWDAVYNRQCTVRVEDTLTPSSLQFVYLNYKTINPSHYWPNDGDAYPPEFYTAPPPHVFYLHIVQDAIVNLVGDVIAGGVKIVPYTCSHDNLPTIPAEYAEKPIYTEVFVLTQFWGSTYFHKILEVMPRIAPYLNFLNTHPSVHIHSPEDRSQVSELLTILGINAERIVTGVTRAKVVYLPQGTPCGFPQTQSIQVLSKLLRDYIVTNILSQAGSDDDRPSIVLIRRSGLRRFLEHDAIEHALKELAVKHSLNFTLFVDNPTPSLRQTMTIFARAKFVIAPHGAGLSNVLFSSPGTYVIEGVCNPPHVNMCFQMAAHALGHHYHGVPSRGGCERVVEVAPETIIEVLQQYLQHES